MKITQIATFWLMIFSRFFSLGPTAMTTKNTLLKKVENSQFVLLPETVTMTGVHVRQFLNIQNWSIP